MDTNKAFPSTHWSLVAMAGREDKEGIREALAHVLGIYMPALRAHLQSHRRISPDLAEELVSGFVTDKVIERDLVSQADQKKGKFRNFLLKSLDYYVKSQMRARGAKKRKSPDGVALRDQEARVRCASRRSDLFDRAWARSLIAEALRRLEGECMACGRESIWGVFKFRVLEPILRDASVPAYDLMASKFGFTSPAQAANALITAKRAFQRQLRSVIGEYALEEEIDDEIALLKRVLADEQPD